MLFTFPLGRCSLVLAEGETVKAQMAQVSLKWALGDCCDRHRFGNIVRKGIGKAAKP